MRVSRSEVSQPADTAICATFIVATVLAVIAICSSVFSTEIEMRSSLPSPFRDLEDDFELDWHTQRKTRNANNEPDRRLLAAEDILEEVGHSVCDSRLIERLSASRHEYSQPYDASNAIKRAQMLSGCSEGTQTRRIGSIPSRIFIKFLPDAPDVLWPMVDNREHTAEE